MEGGGLGFKGLGFVYLGLGFNSFGFVYLGLGLEGFGFVYSGLGFKGFGFVYLGAGSPFVGPVMGWGLCWGPPIHGNYYVYWGR